MKNGSSVALTIGSMEQRRLFLAAFVIHGAPRTGPDAFKSKVPMEGKVDPARPDDIVMSGQEMKIRVPMFTSPRRCMPGMPWNGDENMPPCDADIAMRL